MYKVCTGIFSQPLTRGDFPIGMPSARGVFIEFCDILLNIPLFPPFLRGTFDGRFINRTQVYNTPFCPASLNRHAEEACWRDSLSIIKKMKLNGAICSWHQERNLIFHFKYFKP